MVNQRLRTPRKQKVWIGRNSIVANAITVRAITAELLSAGLTDIGINRVAGVTVMRILGYVQLVNWTAGAVTPAYSSVRMGIAWVPQAIAGAGLDDAQIPVPLNNGLREIRWIQQFELGGLETVAPHVVQTPLLPVEESIVDLDITQMSKQPTPDHRLCLIQAGPQAVEADTTAIDFKLQTMLALP